jgi:serine/threonine-protein kinase RIM15
MKADPNRSTKLSEPSAYRLMEGFGMLMHDRNDGSPTHTMWVLKSLATQEDLGPEVEIGDLVSPGPLSAGPGFHRRAGTDPITPFPFSRPISTAPILCRICECQVPNWFFEKHSETCNEVHRLEAAIGECNESIAELRSTIRDLAAIIERSSPLTVPEYRGQALVQPSPPLSSSALQIFRPPLSSRMQRNSIRKLQRKLVAGLNEILQLAWEISVPSLKEDQAAEPIERQRLLSPESLDKITAVQQWIKPTSDDPALARLIDDAYVLMRTKLDNVNRMQNTIKYSEKVRQEWEEKVERTLTSLAEEEEAIDEAEMGSHSSTTSEYAFEGELRSSDPTPIRAASPASPPSRGSGGSGEKRSPALLPFNTRSSTPSSVSSPLALAIPIVASPEPIQEIDTSQETTPSHPTSRDFVLSSAQTIRARRSAQNLIIEPRFLVTPPLSPLGSPKDSRAHRRHSTVHPILSPTAMVGPGPLSPRIPSVAPSSRTTPSSIKDFEIIKPISKGAFGSVFLAKKKVTGDYYAIKVLRKADMIAKNQITNVKAERMILMTQAESPFVVKLYFTFQSKDNLYLVMEYLNGGDCAALIKTLGSLPEEWTRAYIAEVILGLEHLHDRGVVHRYVFSRFAIPFLSPNDYFAVISNRIICSSTSMVISNSRTLASVELDS